MLNVLKNAVLQYRHGIRDAGSQSMDAVDLNAYRPGSAAVRSILVGVVVLVGAALFWVAVRPEPDRTWMLAAGVAALFVARGLHLCRPITPAHLAGSALCVASSRLVYVTGHAAPGFALLAASGLVLMLPMRSAAQPNEQSRIAELVQRTADDPLSPFALNSTKSYYFNDSGTAAIAYRTRVGIAVVAGDPIGDAHEFAALVDEFSDFATTRGWRVAVLGAGERCRELWTTTGPARKALRAVPIGRDVVIDVGGFSMEGRKFRNLRQAVQRTHNAGVTTEIVDEDALNESTRCTLMAIVDEAHVGRQNRGFSMILDHLLDGTHPGVLVVVARDRIGRAVGFQRYGTANGQRELSLDVPWRSGAAPNGVDERMIVDVIRYAEQTGARSVSLAFAPFPELFDTANPSRFAGLFRLLMHAGDSLISLESLYRYLRKFHSLGHRRYVMLRFRDLVPAAFAFLTLEFLPHYVRIR